MRVVEELWNEIVLKRAFPLLVAFGIITVTVKIFS